MQIQTNSIAQMPLQSNINLPQPKLSPTTHSWVDAIVKSLKLNESQYLSNEKYNKSYTVDISKKGLEAMSKFQDMEVAIYNSDALTYTKKFDINYK